MKKKINNYPFLAEKELKKVREELSDPNYSRINFVLEDNASFLDKTKYEVCQSIARQKRKKKLSLEKTAQQIQLSIPETEEILFSHIHQFTLDRLFSYAEKLNIPLQVINEEKTSQKALRNSVRSKKNISIPPRNNSKTKSIHLRKR